MGFYCKAPRDCGCVLWNFGKVNQEKCNGCMYLANKYDLRECDCGTDEEPLIYGEGVARNYINYIGDKGTIGYSGFDGYVVVDMAMTIDLMRMAT